MEAVQAPDQELLGAGPLPAHEPHGRGGYVQGGRQGPSGLVRGPSAGWGRGPPDQQLFARHLQGRPRTRADAKLDERTTGGRPNCLHAPLSPHERRCRMVGTPDGIMFGQRCRRERVPGQPGQERAGDGGSPVAGPGEHPPRAAARTGRSPKGGARSRRGRAPPVTAVGRGGLRAQRGQRVGAARDGGPSRVVPRGTRLVPVRDGAISFAPREERAGANG